MRFPILKRLRERYMMPITLIFMVAGLIFAYLSPVILVTVPAGHVGVMWYRFGKGTDTENIISEGSHLILPWNRLYDYDARLLTVDQQYDAITKDGLFIHTTLSFRFRINSRYAGVLHKNIGPDYLFVLLVPEVGATARNAISQYTAEELYTTYRSQVRDSILTELKQRIYKQNTIVHNGTNLIEMDQVMLKSIQLPERVNVAIENKIVQYQRELEYDFRLNIETKEAKRKTIEGGGVRAMFDEIGSQDLPSYLRMVGINATLELSRSNNAKIVVTGAPGGLPLILGSDALQPAGPGPQKPAEPAKKEEPPPP